MALLITRIGILYPAGVLLSSASEPKTKITGEIPPVMKDRFIK